MSKPKRPLMQIEIVDQPEARKALKLAMEGDVKALEAVQAMVGSAVTPETIKHFAGRRLRATKL